MSEHSDDPRRLALAVFAHIEEKFGIDNYDNTPADCWYYHIVSNYYATNRNKLKETVGYLSGLLWGLLANHDLSGCCCVVYSLRIVRHYYGLWPEHLL